MKKRSMRTTHIAVACIGQVKRREKVCKGIF